MAEKRKNSVDGFFAHEGKELYKLISPKFRLRDLLQIIIGATILAVPVGFTEETWRLGETLPLWNIFGLMAVSIFFMGSFVYYHYYRNRLKEHFGHFTRRVISTYLASFLIVALILSLIQRAPWAVDTVIAFKRIIIVSLPASMSAAIADTI